MYSSDVRLALEISDRCLYLSKVGPNYVVFQEHTEIELGEAEIVMQVDGRIERWKVMIKRSPLPFELRARTGDIRDSA